MAVKDFKKKVNAYLKDVAQLEDVDDSLLEELYFNLEMIETCKADIRANGIVYNMSQRRNGHPYYAKSQYFLSYQQCLKNVTGILTALALTPRERQKFKAIVVDDGDALDDVLNE